MEFFDCNACFGVSEIPPLRFAATAEELRDEMEFCGVGRALVWHAAMRDDCPTVGNPLLADAIRGKPNLVGTWAILPPQTGEMPAPDEFVARMRANSIRALRAFPAEHRYLLNATTFGALFDLMIQRRIPLILGPEWALVDALLRDFPKLTVIVVGHGNWGQDRFFRPLIERFPNFYIDMSRYELDNGIEEFCKRYGPDRMLFATSFPASSMGGPMLTLKHAAIPDQHKDAIASGNLDRLLKEVRL